MNINSAIAVDDDDDDDLYIGYTTVNSSLTEIFQMKMYTFLCIYLAQA